MEELIKKDQYQVFLLTCPATPWFFARHAWFVINKKGVISRREIIWFKRRDKIHWGHVHKDAFTPFSGIGMFISFLKPYWSARLETMIEGGDDSEAHRMADFVEKSGETYPYKDRYVLLGPNCNTYAGWVLKHFPKSGMKLPWNALGKGYKK